jgi:hypothetical protein
MLGLLLLAGLAGEPEPQAVLASSDDCAIVVAVGRAEVAWGPKGPNQPFVESGPLPDGRSYRQACDWTTLGVGAPSLVTSGQLGPRFAVDRPTYSRDRKAARADLTFVVWSGPGAAPFVSVRHCRLRAVRGVWRLLRCEAGPIT